MASKEGVAFIKEEFVWKKEIEEETKLLSNDFEPEPKKPKIDAANGGDDAEGEKDDKNGTESKDNKRKQWNNDESKRSQRKRGNISRLDRLVLYIFEVLLMYFNISW